MSKDEKKSAPQKEEKPEKQAPPKKTFQDEQRIEYLKGENT